MCFVKKERRKIKMKKIFAVVLGTSMALASVSGAYAKDTESTDIKSAVSTQLSTKRADYIEMHGGSVKISDDSTVKYENEKAGSITTTRTRVNKQEISGEGEVVISSKDKTVYDNVKAPVILDVSVDINTPIVHGDSTDVTFEHESETDMKDVQAGIYLKKSYIYDKAIQLPD
jgi:hypothetical protein